MTNTPTDRIQELNRLQREYFATGATLDLAFRKAFKSRFGVSPRAWQKQKKD